MRPIVVAMGICTQDGRRVVFARFCGYPHDVHMSSTLAFIRLLLTMALAAALVLFPAFLIWSATHLLTPAQWAGQ